MRRTHRTNCRRLLLSGVTTLLSGCFTTTYQVSPGQKADVRLSGPRDDEKILRHVRTEIDEHHYAFGMIPDRENRDIRRSLDLEDHEGLVNLHIESKFTGVDALIIWGTGIISAGIVPAIWMPRTTIIEGDIINVSQP